jgi:aspartate carbamoyltransferase regulatory subunit
MENNETLGRTAKTVIKCLAAAALIIPYRVKIDYTAPDKKEIEKASIKAPLWSVNYDKNRADGEKTKIKLLK